MRPSVLFLGSFFKCLVFDVKVLHVVLFKGDFVIIQFNKITVVKFKLILFVVDFENRTYERTKHLKSQNSYCSLRYVELVHFTAKSNT